jgi:glycosyltransferase involved in cell wall biosynthesis
MVTYSSLLLKHLAAHGGVTVLCYRESEHEFPRAPHVTWDLLPWRPQPRWRSVLGSLPSVAAPYRRAAYVERMLELAATAEAVVIDHLGMAWCTEILARARRGGAAPVLLFLPHDHHKSVRRVVARQVANPVKRAALTWDALKAGRLEDRAVAAADAVLVLTERDAQMYRADHPAVKTLLVQPGYSGAMVQTRQIDATVPRRVCVLGARASFHKHIVLQQCLEALERHEKLADEVDIVGPMEPAHQAELSARYPRLTFRGFVEDLDSYLSTVRLGVLPDAVGGGFKLRALTYALNRVPMVAVRGALAGMGFTPGESYVEADDLDGMVAAARALVDDFPRMNRLAEAAFRHCHGRFDWAQRAADLHDFARRLAKPRDGAQPVAEVIRAPAAG